MIGLRGSNFPILAQHADRRCQWAFPRSEFRHRKALQMQGETDDQLLYSLYEFCETGYQFENFLVLILGALGLEEIQVTQASGDGGVDLVAVRPGIEGLSNADRTIYRIQAKRLKPGTPVSIRDVRALRGVLRSGETGLFISTGRFTSSAEAFLEQDETRPLLLMDGLQVVDICKSQGIGISFYPYFDTDSLRLQMGEEQPTQAPTSDEKKWTWTVNVSVNDVRARILPVPKEILDQLDENLEALTVNLNGKKKALKVNRVRRYVAGVTDTFREAGFLLPDNSRRSGVCHWNYDASNVEAEARLVASVELTTF